MSIYVVASIEVHDPETYARYAELAKVAMDIYKPEVVSLDSDPKMYFGTSQPANLNMIIRFDSIEHFEAFNASAEYQAAYPYRQRSSTTVLTMAMNEYIE